MKKFLFLMALATLVSFSHQVEAQSIERQMEVLSRPTAEPVIMTESFEEFSSILKSSSIDYIMISNSDSVNVFYYENGELNILRPGTCDILVAERDQFNRVINYPYLFFDRASYGRRVYFRVGVCNDCRNSSFGVQFGFFKR